jgi:hypothetical protein
MPYTISKTDVRVDGTTAIISGEGGRRLAQSLVQKNALTLAELATTFGFVHPTEITLGPDGSVHIDNEGVATRANSLNAAADGDFFDTNCSCTKDK